MTVRKLFLPALVVLLGIAGNAAALEDISSEVQAGCASEIKEFCSQVTHGEGRLLACFYAHEDKLSGRCEHTLYQAATTLTNAITALNYVAEACAGDILSLCGDVEMGEGRVVECLKAKSDDVSAGCKGAMSDVFVE
ncbi:MAG: hypothetical protein DRQ60_06450 [Gammaproteobacteria bacterium]|nr:MAG: hypothetical protein DRQ54_05070 [Gammaproteobacteria bacterium]RLA14631.1 MAG: hypothetical protein DRQ60_06450 [Gammaproteobacteria bacterium]RLA14986.1 MAG: hypothetical protein DRQ52_02910 [Gammaproteobacteria bacterium]